ncbi:PA0069 family radical SAM protein [Roseibium hamelinense]|nr:PA0069 family radical SAM protein [Roseibium hamelinense]
MFFLCSQIGAFMDSSAAALLQDGFAADGTSSVPAERRRGRGAGLNTSGRFERTKREYIDDGWDLDDEIPVLKTEVQEERARTIITRNESPDISFDRSINPYRGCEHGCIYCFARPSHAYMGLSPGLDFETRLFAKPNAAELLERELSRPGYSVRSIAIGTNTDPYQPLERRYELMRGILEVLNRYNHPVAIVTKSALITRDTDILADMANRNLVKVAVSVTTLNKKLCRTMEPRASAPHKRLEAVQRLSEAGIPTSVMVAPVIPALTDSEIEKILEAAKDHGAEGAGYVLLRLPREVSELFRDWLFRNRPDSYRHVMSLVRSMRGGKDYDAQWGVRMRGGGPYAEQISKRFSLAAKRLDLSLRQKKLDTASFVSPQKGGVQLDLF